MISGIPDLYVIMPGYLPVLLEAKWFNGLAKSFHRKVPFTELQKNFLEECDKRVKYSAMGLMGFPYNDKVYAVLLSCDSQHFNNFTYNFILDCPHVAIDKHKDFFNVPELFSKVPIPRIEPKAHVPTFDPAANENSVAVSGRRAEGGTT